MNAATGVHQLHISIQLAGAWRAIYFVAAVLFLGAAWTFLHWPTLPLSRRFLMAALSIEIIRTVVTNAERFRAPVYWEALPLESLGLAFACYGMWRWYREARHRT